MRPSLSISSSSILTSLIWAKSTLSSSRGLLKRLVWSCLNSIWNKCSKLTMSLVMGTLISRSSVRCSRRRLGWSITRITRPTMTHTLRRKSGNSRCRATSLTRHQTLWSFSATNWSIGAWEEWSDFSVFLTWWTMTRVEVSLLGSSGRHAKNSSWESAKRISLSFLPRSTLMAMEQWAIKSSSLIWDLPCLKIEWH